MSVHPAARAAVASTIALILVTFSVVVWLGASTLTIPVLTQAPRERIAPITDPTQLPRLSFDRLQYLGAFRLPGGSANGDTFAYGGGPMAFNDARNSLFVAARSGRVAEITVPDPVNSADIPSLPTAEYLQAFEEPTEGHIKDVASEGAGLAGLLVHRGRLYGTGLIYYDATNAQRVSHFSRPISLSSKGATPMRAMWQEKRSGFVAGYLALVPDEWQSRLGGPAITGQCCVPIVSRTSWGPSAFAWEPSEVDLKAEVGAIPLVYYPGDHPTLGPWSGSNPTYGATAEVAGVALIPGTRTALFVGRNGMGPYCYGNGTGDKSLDQTTDKTGTKFCYDPANASKGQHAYPYRYQMWAYDLSEWAEVRAGRREPWSVTPYAVWPFELPTPEASVRILGVAYDPGRRRLYVSQRSADKDTYTSRALLHVFHLP
jgi:hypothetical protein